MICDRIRGDVERLDSIYLRKEGKGGKYLEKENTTRGPQKIKNSAL